MGLKKLTRRQFEAGMVMAGLSALVPGSMQAAEDDGYSTLRMHASERGLLYGCAVRPELLDLEFGHSTLNAYTRLVATQTGILVAENAMKWRGLRPTATSFDFTQADRLMRFASENGQQVRGHNLCWHLALPDWFAQTATKDNAAELLKTHILTVAGRYRGQLASWDVVNEAIDPNDGRPDGLRKSPWLELLGPGYIELAFRTAAQADPTAKLVYNDYGIELDTREQVEKRGQVMLLIRRMKARGIPIHAVGIQGHLDASGARPGAGLVSFVRELATLGLDVYLTELDVNTHTLEGGAEVQDAAVAESYRQFLGLLLNEPNVKQVLTWGITSAYTWLNETDLAWAHRPDGMRQRPLPFDDQLQPTAAFEALRTSFDAAHAGVRAAQMPRESVKTGIPDPDPATLYQPFAVPGSPGSEPLSGKQKP